MVKVKIKGTYFDRAEVINAVGRARAQVLKKFGLLVRRTAQRSLKYSEKTSAPGAVPFVHKTGFRKTTSKSTGKTRTRAVSYLRDRLISDYDLSSKSVVVGPMRLPNTKHPESLPIIEYGGTVRGDGREIFIANAAGRDKKTGRFVSGGKTKLTLTGPSKHAARPFMRPALAEKLPELPPLWKDSVKK